MRRSLVIAGIVLLGLLGSPVAVRADMPVPGGSSAFGQHVAGMAPEHPREHGAMFGACVSTMATTGNCPHHGGLP